MSEITKRPRIGLALGSGSARGFAHIGVVAALEENGIPIDCICGCSAGAIIGSIYCAGGDVNMFAKVCIQMTARELLDFTVPRRGLVRGDRFEALLRLTTKNLTFDQMKIPFACVAVDINAGKIKLFDSGKVAPAVRASMSIPGIFEPKEIDGVKYMDGGVLVPVPSSYTRSMGADIVISVDVGLHKVRPVEVGNSIWEVFLRSQDLMGAIVAKEEMNMGDVLIIPEVSGIHPYSTVDTDKAIRLGYEAAMVKMDDIKKAVGILPAAGKRIPQRLHRVESLGIVES